VVEQLVASRERLLGVGSLGRPLTLKVTGFWNVIPCTLNVLDKSTTPIFIALLLEYKTSEPRKKRNFPGRQDHFVLTVSIPDST
jgi:hypothetical protein